MSRFGQRKLSFRNLGLCVALGAGALFADPAISSPSKNSGSSTDHGAQKKPGVKPKKNSVSPSPKNSSAPALPAALASSQNNPLVSEEQRDFLRAQDLVKLGKESEALLSLSDFLRRHPTSSLADDAQFLVGEIYFRQRKYEDAAAEYKKVFRYGVHQSDRIAEAVFQIGECWFRLKRMSDARIEWEALRRKFPNSEAASKALVSLAGVP